MIHTYVFLLQQFLRIYCFYLLVILNQFFFDLHIYTCSIPFFTVFPKQMANIIANIWNIENKSFTLFMAIYWVLFFLYYVRLRKSIWFKFSYPFLCTLKILSSNSILLVTSTIMSVLTQIKMLPNISANQNTLEREFEEKDNWLRNRQLNRS